MLIPNLQSWCRALATRLHTANHIKTVSFGCVRQLCQLNNTYTQMNHSRTAIIDPQIIKSLTPLGGSVEAQPFKKVLNQQTGSLLSAGMISNINKITIKLPGLNKPESFIYSVPLGYYKHLPLEKNLPPLIHQEKLDPKPGVEIREPTTIYSNLEKMAVHLIQIRKMKMKKHQRIKLRKRMFFVWAKLRERRRARFEKHFVGCQLARIKSAEDFNAEEWVNEYLHKSTTDPETLIVKKPFVPRPTKYVF